MKTAYAVLALFVLALFAFAGCQQQTNSVTVTGTYQVTVDPDQAEVYAGVSTLKPTAKEAQDETNKVINAIIAGLKASGINEKDIETQNLNLYQNMEWVDNEYKANGWKADQMLKVTTKDLTKVGAIVDAAVNNGANSIQGVSFSLSQDSEKAYKLQVIAKATEDARAKAETIAASLNAKLGKVKSVSEAGFNYMPYRYDTMAGVSMEKAVADVANVQPQKVTVDATVTVEYYVG